MTFYSKYRNFKFFKITNINEYHDNHQYITGQNGPNSSQISNRLYFTDSANIHKFYDKGIYLREIYLPFDHCDFFMIKEGNGFYANKIILGFRYILTDLDENTCDKFGIICPNFSCLLATAIQTTNIEFLQKHKYQIIHDQKIKSFDIGSYIYAADLASGLGKIEILNWLTNSCEDIRLNNIISTKTYFEIFRDMICGQNYEFKYSTKSVQYASKYGHIQVLEWWENYMLKNNIVFHLQGK